MHPGPSESQLRMHSLPLLYQDEVRREWVDYNGHMRDAYYLLLFSHATDALIDAIGLDAAGRARSGHSVYTLEVHLNYLQELKEGQALQVRWRLLGHDAKRLHIMLQLYRGAESQPVALCEQMLLHVDTVQGRSAPFAADVAGRIAAMAGVQAELPLPEYGRRIALPAA